MIEHRLVGLVAGAAVAAGLLTGCSDSVGGSPSAGAVATSPKAVTSTPHVVVFTITGDGPVPVVTYLDNGKTVTEHDIKLPWTRTVRIPAGPGVRKWDLDIPQSGTSTATATVDGQPMGQSSGSGSGSGGGPDLHLSGTIGG